MATMVPLLLALAAAGVGAAKQASAANATWWWRAALGAPAVAPDFGVIEAHVCAMEAACVPPCVWSGRAADAHWRPHSRLTLLVDAWPYFPCVGGGRGGELVAWSAPGYAPLGAKRFDGLGHAAEDVIKEYIRAMRSAMNGGGGVARRGAHLFGENVSRTGAYLRDVRGIADGYAPSLYCHARDSVVWSEAFLATLKPYERLKLHTRRVDKKLIPFYVDRFPTGAALFRDHFECFLVPDLDEWFGFHTLPSRHAADVGVESLLAPVRDRLEELVVEITNRRDGLRSVGGDSFRDVTTAVDAHRQTLAALNATVQAMDADLGAVETRVDEAFAWPAIAEAYHAVDRGGFVGTCGTADRPPKLRVAIHVRLGDLKANDRGARDAAEALRASLRVAADLQHREAATKGRVHVLVVSDSSAAEIVAALARAPSRRQRPVAVERPARRWSDGVSHFEEAATSGLRPGDLTLTFLGAGNPLVALDCLASANVVLSPCVTPDPLFSLPTNDNTLSLLHNGQRCSNFVVLARYLSFGVFRGVPSAELGPGDVANATAAVAAALAEARDRAWMGS